MKNGEEFYLGHKIIPSKLYEGCFIVLMPKEDGTKGYVMEHFSSIEEAKAYIDKVEDKPETWFERHLM